MFANNLKVLDEYDSLGSILPLRESKYESKYYMIAQEGIEYLLVRYYSPYCLIDFDKINFYELMRQNNIPTNRIVQYGICSSKEEFYILFSWIRGCDLSKKINYLKTEEQYAIGLKAGKFLKQIHNIKGNNFGGDIKNIHSRISTVYDKYEQDVLNYRRYPLLKEMICRLNKCSDIKQGKKVILHGDYSLHNLIYNGDNLSIIDWLINCFGEIEEDFVRNIVNAEISSYFAAGQVDGYFNNNVPNDFWRKLYYHTIAHQLEIIEFRNFDERFNDEFINHQHELVIKEYSIFNNFIPQYYEKGRMYNGVGR